MTRRRKDDEWMFYNQTQYARNRKDKNAIVYEDVFGDTIRITADVLGKELFEYWKSWMDKSLHEEAKETHLYYDHTISMEDPSLIGIAIPDQETFLIEAEERAARDALKQQACVAFFSCLSDAQQARLWLYAIEGLTSREIAEVEGVSQPAVIHSLSVSRKNILKFLKKGGYQNAVFAAYSEGIIN